LFSLNFKKKYSRSNEGGKMKKIKNVRNVKNCRDEKVKENIDSTGRFNYIASSI